MPWVANCYSSNLRESTVKKEKNVSLREIRDKATDSLFKNKEECMHEKERYKIMKLNRGHTVTYSLLKEKNV